MRFFIGSLFFFSGLLWAGQVTVTKSSEPQVDVWQLKQQLHQQHLWREAMRQQQNLFWISQLPIGCLVLPKPVNYFQCGQVFYRPYLYQGEQIYIQVDPPSEPKIQINK